MWCSLLLQKKNVNISKYLSVPAAVPWDSELPHSHARRRNNLLAMAMDFMFKVLRRLLHLLGNEDGSYKNDDKWLAVAHL